MTRRPQRTATEHTLPYHSLSPRQFEELCLYLVQREGYPDAEHLGAAGSEQGRDLLARKGEKLYAFQCKRVRSFGAGDAAKEVIKLRALPRDQRPHEVIFIVSADVSAATREKTIKRCGARLGCRFWALTGKN